MNAVSISGGNVSPVVNDPDLGIISVYRQLIPSKASTEYTVFFHRDGEKYRTDVLIHEDDLSLNDDHVEEFVRQMVINEIDAGNYRPAKSAIQ